MDRETIIKNGMTKYKDYPIKDVTYFDLNPIYADYKLRRHLVEGCYDIMANIDTTRKSLWYTEYDYIAVIGSRGFLIGSILAEKFQKGIILLRSKPGRLPGKTSIINHTLEYGESQIEVQNGKGKILIFDDVIASGGTSRAAQEVLRMAGYTPISALFLINLEYCNPYMDLPYESVITIGEK